MKNTARKTKLLMIGGPTATGKSALGVRLAQRFNGEIINGDAFQGYRELNIGTAKITPEEMAGIPHHLLNTRPPTAPYSVAAFQREATAAIQAITARNHLPIVVGGTGFYLNALRLGLPLGGDAPPSESRTKWQEALVEHDANWLWAQLNARDSAAATAIPVGNTRRVIRALEVIDTTGTLFSAQGPPDERYDTLVIGLTTARADLYARINARVDAMVAAGLETEVRTLLDEVPPDAQALSAIGYKEWLPYFAGTTTRAAAIATIKQNSRHYAKRQLTYFRRQLPTHWFDLIAASNAEQAVVALVAAWQNDGLTEDM